MAVGTQLREESCFALMENVKNQATVTVGHQISNDGKILTYSCCISKTHSDIVGRIFHLRLIRYSPKESTNDHHAYFFFYNSL